MHDRNLQPWQHSHSFGQDRKRPGELRTIVVIAVTATMMVVEIATGVLFGSMALLADGLHMASHAAALSITAFAYVYARRHAHDARYSFGTGKVNALGGFASAVLLAVFALMMIWESAHRMIAPVPIALDGAILVAVLGLMVNGGSALILVAGREDHHGEHSHEHAGPEHHHDHNLQAAYLHVMADALTSVLAIFALLAAKYFGLVWMDPLMGVVGAAMVARWSTGLIRATGAVLLDQQAAEPIRSAVKQSLEDDDCRVADLHVWSIGPDIHAAIVSVVAHDPRSPEHYKELLPPDLGLVHVTVEVHQCVDEDAQRDGPAQTAGPVRSQS